MTLDSKKRLISLIIITLYAVVLISFFLTPFDNSFSLILRLCALLGLLSMSIAAVMTPFAVELYKIFGKSFLKIHHIFAVVGIVLITLHPVIFAIYKADLSVFIPVLNDWVLFWELAGRPALILIYIGVIAGLLRNRYKNSWKKVHAVLYIALFFGLVHGTLIGSSFINSWLITILFYALFIFVVIALILKRYKNYKRKKKMETRKQQANK